MHQTRIALRFALSSLRPPADTNNVGQKLRDGANINRSLLALANCINALGKQVMSALLPCLGI